MKPADPFHYISTPVPLLPNLGLRVKAGLSGEDPAGRRHAGLGFSVWLTLYSPRGEKVKRWKAAELPAGERLLLDLSAATTEFGFQEPHLAVVHRVPEGLAEGAEADFDMFRTVVQLERPGRGSGSVIYETPPGFNARPGQGSFFSFTNQAVNGPEAATFLVLLHYSVNPAYAHAAKRRVVLYDPDGSLAAVDDGTLPPFTVGLTDLSALAPAGDRLRQLSLAVCSPNASLIPLFLNLDRRLGGVSVEHTHPPFTYLGMPVAAAAKLRRDAIDFHLAVRP